MSGGTLIINIPDLRKEIHNFDAMLCLCSWLSEHTPVYFSAKHINI